MTRHERINALLKRKPALGVQARLEALGFKPVPCKPKKLTKAERKEERERHREIVNFLRRLDAAEKRASKSKLIVGGPQK